MATFHLQIVSPDRVAFDGQAQSVVVRTITGDVCILAHHIDYAAPLSIGQAKVTDENGNVRYAACNSGLLSVAGDEVRIVTTTFEWNDEIDLERAEKAKLTAEERLKELKRQDVKYAITEAKLKRAIARIHTKNM